MHTADERVGLSDNHARGKNVLSLEPGELPNAGEGKRLQVFAPEAIGLFSILPLLPLAKTGRGNQTTPLGKRSTEERLFINRLRSRINVGNFWLLFHPEGDEAPPGHDHFTSIAEESSSEERA
jgi:hypothetical protein